MKKSFFLPAIFFIAIFSIFLLSNCKKDKNTIHIAGTVFDPNTNAYVQGAHITISASKITSGFYNSNYTDIATTTSDANGVFTFEFEKDKTAGYRFYVYKDKYFDLTTDVLEESIQPGSTYTPKFTIYPEAYIKLRVKNYIPFNSNDFIAYSYTTSMPQCMSCCTNTTFKGYGTSYDTLIKCKSYGNYRVKLNWHVTKAGSDVAYSDSIYAVAFDTTFYQLNY